jgi:hypothetical protein
MGKRLNRFESAASDRSWVVARPRFWERAFPMAGLVCGQGGVLTFGPTSSIPVLQLGFLLHIFCKLSTLSIRPRAATEPANLPACRPSTGH